MKNLLSFTEGFYPSEWFALGCVIGLIIGMIGCVISGIVCKVKQKKDEKMNKQQGFLCMLSLILLGLSLFYLLSLSIGKISAIFIIAIMGLIKKVKPNVGNFSHIGISILVCLLMYAPIIGFVAWDNHIEDKENQQLRQLEEEIATEVSQTEVLEGVTMDDIIMNYDNVNQTFWYANYSEYADEWRINVTGEYKKEDSYVSDSIISIRFVLKTNEGSFEVDEVKIYDLDTEERDYTTYSKAESEQIFKDMIKEVK